MAIKLIAVDMDGTFLDDQMNYDFEKFTNQYKKMKQEGIRFVVASGNQYYQLRSFFDGIHKEISFVAENGALIIDQDEEITSVDIPKKDVHFILKELIQHTDISVVLCGRKSAYVLDSVSDSLYRTVNKYYLRLEKVANYDEVEDQILKFALATPRDKTFQFQELLYTKIGQVVTPVSSGHGSIDLIVPEFHKASGIQLLQEKWNIKDEETMAFGDGGNDIEMLDHVKYSFAMENGLQQAKNAAKYIAPSNNNSGVLEVIDQYFANQGPFKD